jgi:FkbM family methyltransferase
MSLLLHWMVKYLPSPFRDSLFYRFLPKFTIPKGSEKNISFKASRSLSLTGINTDIISKSIYFRGYYEKKLTKLVADIGRNGGVMVDVGANIGYFGISFASYNAGNKVYAFEPSERNFQLLSDNIKANNLLNQVMPFKLALSNSSGELFFDPGPEHQTGWGHLSDTPTLQKVQVTTLNEFFKDKTDHIDLLKIDVEGADLKVILGASDLFRQRRISKVVFEYWDDFFGDANLPGTEAEMINRLMIESGYSIAKKEEGAYWILMNLHD